jgi:hypothetical protein
MAHNVSDQKSERTRSGVVMIVASSQKNAIAYRY